MVWVFVRGVLSGVYSVLPVLIFRVKNYAPPRTRPRGSEARTIDEVEKGRPVANLRPGLEDVSTVERPQ